MRRGPFFFVGGVVLLPILALVTCRKTPSEPSPLECSYAVSQTSIAVGAEGGSGTVALVTRASCEWTASSDAPWLTVQPSSGTGSGNVTYSVGANDAAVSRVGLLKIHDITVAITQAGRMPCTYDVSPRSVTFAGEGGNGTLRVLAPAACTWTPTTSADWVTFVSKGPEKGDGDIAYSVARNGGSASRTGVITVAGVDVTLSQAAIQAPPTPGDCEYQVSPTEFVLHWHQTGGDVNLVTKAGCSWTVAPDADWLGLSTPGQGDGSAKISFTNSVYKDEGSRRAPLQIRWPAATAGQNVWITQEGCRFALSRTSQSMPASGGSDRIDVFADPISPTCPISCSFTAVSNAAWLRITSQGTGPGMRDTGFVSYAVDPNATGSPRTATITVEKLTLTITQAAN